MKRSLLSLFLAVGLSNACSPATSEPSPRDAAGTQPSERDAGLTDDVDGGTLPSDAGQRPSDGGQLPNDAGQPPASGIHFPPAGKVSWDWQIGAGGDAAILPPAGAKLMDIDVFSTSAAKVTALKAQGIYTVCYVNAGSWQPGLPDSNQYPDRLKIQRDPDWPDEYFLDVTDVFKPSSVLATILRSRFKLCKEKGFDALEPDNLQNDENVSGGRITTQQQLDFNGWVADEAHAAGLAVFQKNGPDKVMSADRTGKRMVEKFDGILNEECQQYDECAPLAEFVKRGKLALNVEYTGTLNCQLFSSLGINAIRKDLGLVGATMPGYRLNTCP